jgi:hypothetical protein
VKPGFLASVRRAYLKSCQSESIGVPPRSGVDGLWAENMP